MSNPPLRRAAHFLSWPELATSPPNEALISALLEQGFAVDLYAPGRMDIAQYGDRVAGFDAEYSQRWIASNVLSTRWRQYDLVSGTTEDPMAIVGVISALFRIPSVTLADEIKTYSFSGNRSARWKKLCRWAMRRSEFTIVNSKEKVPLQIAYAGLPEDHPIALFPGCFRDPPAPVDRAAYRAEHNIPEDATVLCYSGVFGQPWGADWMVAALNSGLDLHVLGQFINIDPLTRRLLAELKRSNRLHMTRERVPWQDAWASIGAVDIGMVVYHHDAPQFQNNGLASNRLCMFLAMGVPVAASRQKSFEFLEEYDCGVLATTEQEFVEAIARIQARLPEMKANALRCAREYIDAPARYRELQSALENVLGH